MDKRKILIPILFLVAASVSFVIYGCGSGVVGGGGGGGTAPIITNLGPASLTVMTIPTGSQLCTIEISWTTDVAATTKVIYYLATAESGTALSTESLSLTLSHVATITANSNDFCYRAISKNEAGLERISSLDSPIVYVVMGSATTDADMDTYLNQSWPPPAGCGLNYGASTTLNVGDGGGFELRALLSFEVTSHVPAYRKIDYATLILLCVPGGSMGGMPVDVYANVDPWVEGVDGVGGVGGLTIPSATWWSPVDWPPASGAPWTIPFNLPAFLVPPLLAGGGSPPNGGSSPPFPPPAPLIAPPTMVGGPGAYYYFGDVSAGLSTNGLILVYTILPAPGAPDIKIFSSREGPNPPQLKLYLKKE